MYIHLHIKGTVYFVIDITRNSFLKIQWKFLIRRFTIAENYCVLSDLSSHNAVLSKNSSTQSLVTQFKHFLIIFEKLVRL